MSLPGYAKNKEFSAVRASGAVTNYQMLILVGESSGATGADMHCGGECLSTFDDIRFTNSSDTLLDYWIEKIDTTYGSGNYIAHIWVEFDSIGTSKTTFYMYYSNPSASPYSNGVNTFIFFDDFERGSDGDMLGNNWAEDHVSISTAQAYSPTRSAKIPYVVAFRSSMGRVCFPSDNKAFRMRIYKEADTNWMFPMVHGNGSKQVYIRITDGGFVHYYDGSFHITSQHLTALTWNVLDVYNLNFTAGTYSVSVNDGGTSDVCVMNSAAQISGDVYMYGDEFTTDADWWVDNFIIRNYYNPEPALTFPTPHLTWNGGTPVEITTDGSYTLTDAGGDSLTLTVVYNSLPSDDTSDMLTISSSYDRQKGLLRVNPNVVGRAALDNYIPTRYFPWGNEIKLDPVPDDEYTINLYISDFPSTALSSDTDELSALPEEFHECSVYFSCYVLCVKMKKWATAKDFYNKYIDSLEKKYKIYMDRKSETRKEKMFVDFSIKTKEYTDELNKKTMPDFVIRRR